MSEGYYPLIVSEWTDSNRRPRRPERRALPATTDIQTLSRGRQTRTAGLADPNGARYQLRYTPN